MKFSLSILTLVSATLAAYVPSEPWSTLTPSATANSCAVTDYATSFGIAISTITTEVNVKAKRDLATQIGDGQIQFTTKTESDVTITEAETVYITSKPSSVKASAGSHPAVIVTQIGDGQIQAPNPTPEYTEVVETTSSDGHIVSTTSISPITSSSSFSYRSISSKTSSSASATSSGCSIGSVAKQATCKTANDLAISLQNGILKDSHDRIGAIVSNRQFQFDGPTPQAGTIYAAGWSIVDGHLTIGGDYIFWECLSGTFYNLYDQSIGAQCVPVVLNIVDLVDC